MQSQIREIQQFVRSHHNVRLEEIQMNIHPAPTREQVKEAVAKMRDEDWDGVKSYHLFSHSDTIFNPGDVWEWRDLQHLLEQARKEWSKQGNKKQYMHYKLSSEDVTSKKFHIFSLLLDEMEDGVEKARLQQTLKSIERGKQKNQARR